MGQQWSAVYDPRVVVSECSRVLLQKVCSTALCYRLCSTERDLLLEFENDWNFDAVRDVWRLSISISAKNVESTFQRIIIRIQCIHRVFNAGIRIKR